MPDQTVNLVDQDGTAITVPVDQAASLLSRGYRQEQVDEAVGRTIRDARQETYGGAGGKVLTFGAGALSGATLGMSDVGLGLLGAGEDLTALREVNPNTALAGQVAGEIIPAIATGGESLAMEGLPAARLSRFAGDVAEHIPGSGILGRTARLAASGATEGAVSNAGQYLGQMALSDKPASAEGFLASMRDGALYGGTAAGALGIAGEGLIAARRLLPETDLTPIAARRAKATAVQEVSRAVDDSGDLVEAARTRARKIREEAVAAQPELRVELDKIALQKAKDLADAQTASARARQMKAEADAAAAGSRADAAAARAERAKNPPKRGKKAPDVETPAASEPGLAQDAAGAVAETVTPSQVPSGLNSAIPEVPQTPDDMIRKLMDTKNALDNGSTLSDLSARQKETLVEDALNQHVAKFNPDMERLLRHLDGLDSARNQVAGWLDRYGANSKVKGFEYAEGMRKQSGYAEVVPQGEGNILKPRGREFELRGGPGAAEGFEAKVQRGDLHRIVDDPLATAEEKAAAAKALTLEGDARAQALADIQATRGTHGIDRLDPKATAKEIVGASEEQLAHGPTVDDHVERALNGHEDLHTDVDDATDAISSLEQKTADLADELGVEAPPMAQERARGFRQAQAGADESAAKASEAMIGDADRAAKTIGLGAAPAKAASGLMGKVETAGQLLEALQMLGIDVPSAKNLPVVGPLLSMYLKAKLAMRAVSRLGGRVPRTAETEIARRAAETKTRVIRAADKALSVAGRVATSPRAAVAASVLSAQLFDDRDPGTKEKKTSAKSTMPELYHARKDELERAQAPGAVYEAVRKRVRTADGPLLNAIVSAEQKKLKFLYDKMPQVADSPSMFGKRPVTAPARADMEKWAKYVEAAHRPVETLESILTGRLVSPEGAETLRTVFGTLVAQAQERMIEKAVDGGVEIPHRQKVHLSMSLGIPLDDSQSPEAAQFMGMLYQPKSGGGQPQGMPSGGPPPAVASRVDPETRNAISAL